MFKSQKFGPSATRNAAPCAFVPFSGMTVGWCRRLRLGPPIPGAEGAEWRLLGTPTPGVAGDVYWDCVCAKLWLRPKQADERTTLSSFWRCRRWSDDEGALRQDVDESGRGPRTAVAEAVASPLGVQPTINSAGVSSSMGQLLGTMQL